TPLFRSSHQRLVQDSDTVLADRPHRQLGLGWKAELANDDHVEWSVEGPRHLVGDRDTAAGETEHDDVFVSEMPEMLRQPAAGFRPVPEHVSRGSLQPGSASPPGAPDPISARNCGRPSPLQDLRPSTRRTPGGTVFEKGL